MDDAKAKFYEASGGLGLVTHDALMRLNLKWNGTRTQLTAGNRYLRRKTTSLTTRLGKPANNLLELGRWGEPQLIERSGVRSRLRPQMQPRTV